jgi:hypothetical protein
LFRLIRNLFNPLAKNVMRLRGFNALLRSPCASKLGAFSPSARNLCAAPVPGARAAAAAVFALMGRAGSAHPTVVERTVDWLYGALEEDAPCAA